MTSTSHANERGSSRERRRRRKAVVAAHGWPDAGIVVCWLCELVMGLADFTIDRVVPGIEGGTYALSNCRPCCRPCNLERGGRLGAARRARA